MNRIIDKKRIFILAAVFAVLLVIYFVFLYKLQIIEGQEYYEESKNSTVVTSTVEAARGNILDRYGRMLVTNKSCYNLTINVNDLFYVDGVDANATILQLVNMVREYGDDYNDELPITTEPPFEYTEISDVDKVLLDAYKEKNGLDENASAVEVMSSMRTRYEIDSSYTAEEARIIASVRYSVNIRYVIEGGTSDYIFVEDADMDLIATILENNISGINVEESYVREYNTEYAAHLLGYTRLMDAEQYEIYKEQGYSADTKVGQDGVEYAFEKYLHGTNGTVQVMSAADGTVTGKVYTKEPEPGNNVYLTIDIALQEAAERALSTGIDELKEKVEENREKERAEGTYDENYADEITGGSIVVVDVDTGEPLAIASYPTFDLSELLENYEEISEEDNNPLFNRALMGAYAPGSTFKPCTSIAALTEKCIDTSYSVKCEGIYTKYAASGYTPQCWIVSYGGTHGNENVTLAIRDSCNYFFYTVGEKVGITKMGKYAKLLGLGESTGIELPETTGAMASPLTHGEDWHVGDTLQAAIGQSDSTFTPLQLAEYCAAVANSGTRHSASVLKAVRSFDYSENIYTREAEVLSVVESDAENWTAIQEGMHLAANDPSASAYQYFATYTASSIACKTGTAQRGDMVETDATFICYAPFDDPEIAISIVIERGGSGSNCATIAREVLETYFAIQSATDTTETEGTLLK